MADEIPKVSRAVEISELKDAQVQVTSDNRLQVEFRIDDLIRKLMPAGTTLAGNCGGCNGCMGCSM